MKQPYIVAGRRGWWEAYSSKWAWFFGREPILREKSWTAFQQALENLKDGKRREQPAAA